MNLISAWLHFQAVADVTLSVATMQMIMILSEIQSNNPEWRKFLWWIFQRLQTAFTLLSLVLFMSIQAVHRLSITAKTDMGREWFLEHPLTIIRNKKIYVYIYILNKHNIVPKAIWESKEKSSLRTSLSLWHISIVGTRYWWSHRKKIHLSFNSYICRKHRKTTLISASHVYFHRILIFFHLVLFFLFFYFLCSTLQFFTTNVIILQLGSHLVLILDLRSKSINWATRRLSWLSTTPVEVSRQSVSSPCCRSLPLADHRWQALAPPPVRL